MDAAEEGAEITWATVLMDTATTKNEKGMLCTASNVYEYFIGVR